MLNTISPAADGIGAEQFALERRAVGEDQDAGTHVHALHCMFIHRRAHSVDDRRHPVQHRVAHLAAQLHPGVRRVAAAAGELGRDHLPRLVGVEHDEVRRVADVDRTAVTSAIRAIAAGLQVSARDDVHDAHSGVAQNRQAHTERRLQAEHPRRRLVERSLLRLPRMRGVVGGDGVDRAVDDALDERLDVGLRAQRWVDLEQRVEATQSVLRERQVVRRHLGA